MEEFKQAPEGNGVEKRTNDDGMSVPFPARHMTKQMQGRNDCNCQRTKHQHLLLLPNSFSLCHLQQNSIGLTLLGHVPGIGYAWYIIYKNKDDPNLSHRHGRTYVAVPQQQHYQQQQPQHYQATAPAN
jgi:hypothetical protein